MHSKQVPPKIAGKIGEQHSTSSQSLNAQFHFIDAFHRSSVVYIVNEITDKLLTMHNVKKFAVGV